MEREGAAIGIFLTLNVPRARDGAGRRVRLTAACDFASLSADPVTLERGRDVDKATASLVSRFQVAQPSGSRAKGGGFLFPVVAAFGHLQFKRPVPEESRPAAA